MTSHPAGGSSPSLLTPAHHSIDRRYEVTSTHAGVASEIGSSENSKHSW
jgi:hypothetical protein